MKQHSSLNRQLDFSEAQRGQKAFQWVHGLEEILHLDATMNAVFQQPRHRAIVDWKDGLSVSMGSRRYRSFSWRALSS